MSAINRSTWYCDPGPVARGPWPVARGVAALTWRWCLWQSLLQLLSGGRPSSSTWAPRLARAHRRPAATPDRCLRRDLDTHGGTTQTRRRREGRVLASRPPSATAALARLVLLYGRSMRWRRRLAHDYSGTRECAPGAPRPARRGGGGRGRAARTGAPRSGARTIDSVRRALRSLRNQTHTNTKHPLFQWWR